MASPSTTPAGNKPVIVGLFGLPGSGKSTLKDQLQKEDICISHFMFFEGSEVLDGIVPGGLPAFKLLGEQEKTFRREEAIRLISKKCGDDNKMGVVTGHYMFWKEGEPMPQSVLTREDWRVFTHIAYLDLPADRIRSQIIEDDARTDRAPASLAHLKSWQEAEKQGIATHCSEGNIMFHDLKQDSEAILDKTLEYLNRVRAEVKLDSIINSNASTLRNVLLLDGDKTLIPYDTGEMFWRFYNGTNPLKAIFNQGYSYRTFRKATLLYREPPENVFRGICDAVAREVYIYQEFGALLKEVEKHEHIAVIVVTCGLGKIWETLLRAKGVSEKVHIVGSETNGVVITPELKGVLVDRLHEVHKKFVWAFGDSPMDLPMLRKADQAIVVVGDKDTRSRSMENELAMEIDRGFQAHQALMHGGGTRPLLDTNRLPLVWLQDLEFVQRIIQAPPRLQCLHATDKDSARLLMSATRDAQCKGPALVDAHRLMGRYLATEYLGTSLGLETYKMQHVQGGEIDGHRLVEEANTVIVPLMRGGEPMARGVWEAFPTCMYVHAKFPSDLQQTDHIIGRAAIVLVDGVVNTGKSIVDFVKRIRGCDPKVKIVVIAGVIQKQALEEGGVLERLSHRHGGLSLVALRISENKYKGTGSTDTGHRLFNTTHME